MLVSKRRLLAAALALAFLLTIGLMLWQSRRPTPVYHITDLGVLPGYVSSQAVAINSRGEVIISNYRPQTARVHAGLYQSSVQHDLGTLAGANETEARGINSLSDVTGTATLGRAPHAFLYHNGKMQDLGTLPGFPYSRGVGINDKGEITGNLINYAAPPGQAQRHFFVVRNRKMTDLGIPPGCLTIYASSINAAGDIFGYCEQVPARGGQRQPFVYDNLTGKITLLALPAPYSNGWAIQGNNQGQIIGRGLVPSTFHTVLWNGGHLTDLGNIPGYDESMGCGLNNRGQAVGICFRDDNLSIYRNFLHNVLHLPERQSECAFVYQNGKMQELNDLISNDADWTLEKAASINDAGQIVGHGLHHGDMRAFLLTPTR